MNIAASASFVSFPTILALEVSIDRCTVGLLYEGSCIWRAASGGRAAESILPCIETLLAEHEVSRSALDAVAFSAGPGGFTGLRVACGVAQGLGWALDRPLLAVDSLAAVAWQVAALETQRVAVAIDARMGEVYAGLYSVDPKGEVQTVQAPWLANPDALAATFAQELDPSAAWVAAGDAFRVYPQLVESVTPSRWGRVDATLSPRADAIGCIGASLWREGVRVSAQDAAPIYVRNKVALDVGEQRALRVSRGQI